LTEDSPFNPVTPYAVAKGRAETGIRSLASPNFSPVILRNATAYGFSPRLRFDLVVNNLVAWASATGMVRLKSDGSAWRPLVHVEDISNVFVATLSVPRQEIHDAVLNVGNTDENFQIRDVAKMVCAAVPDSRVEFAAGASADTRCYRVDCSLLLKTFPKLRLKWNVARGSAEIAAALREQPTDPNDFEGQAYARLPHLRRLISEGRVDATLRWCPGETPCPK
jgi:nucleoside-diphosphate-sugar epimerase